MGNSPGFYINTASRTDGRPTKYDLFTQPLQCDCLCFSRHICYCLILKKKSGCAVDNEIKVQHTQSTCPWQETQSVNINLPDRKSKCGICHTSSARSPVFLQSGKRWRGAGRGSSEDGEVDVEIDDLDGKTKGPRGT